jgi:hypothetical protein
VRSTDRRHANDALAICDTIDDAEDREAVLGDLATLPFERDA